MATKSKIATQVEAWLAEVHTAGFVAERPRRDVVTVTRRFTPGDVGSYTAAERDAWELIRQVPTVTYGSTWGTTSDGVGGHAGLTAGEMRLSCSGVSKRFTAALDRTIVEAVTR